MKRTIVIGLDQADASRWALEFALDLFARGEATIHVVRCIEEHDAGTRESPHRLERTNVERKSLERLLHRTHSDDGDVSIHVLFGPSPASLLCEVSERVNADLVVVGAHNAGDSCAFLVGSCAEGVLRGAGRPVLVVRKPKAVTPIAPSTETDLGSVTSPSQSA